MKKNFSDFLSIPKLLAGMVWGLVCAYLSYDILGKYAKSDIGMYLMLIIFVFLYSVGYNFIEYIFGIKNIDTE